jgi:plastocyanin
MTEECIMSHRFVQVLALAGLGSALLGWTASHGTRVAAPRTVVVKTVDVSPTQYQFDPAEITVSPGDTIRFEQTSAMMPHNVEFKDVPAGTKLGDGRVGPFLTKPGDSYVIAVDGRFAAGVHHFVCTPHEALGMKGTITVK